MGGGGRLGKEQMQFEQPEKNLSVSPLKLFEGEGKGKDACI